MTTRGSSPRMRGTRKTTCMCYAHDGIIPADAGNTFSCFCGWFLSGDHPRGCGEHSTSVPAKMALRGSSPRMRGTQGDAHPNEQTPRIIPADAGNTRVRGQACAGCRDHPRGCGEHSARLRRLSASAGSSPRMRGTPKPSATGSQIPRIIPADAGNTH